MSDVVYLHIGAPKSGTTYLQDRLAQNVAQLAENGVHFPSRLRDGDPATFHFRAALDLLGQDWGGPEGHAKGAWNQMVRKARRAKGSVVISHEILAPASPEKVRKVMKDLRGAEVHIVYSARDLGRSMPAAWQESVKQGRQWRFGRFLDLAERGETFFMKSFDLPKVLGTWSDTLPPEQVHLVTVPQRGPADELWLRFCRALRIDPDWAPEDSRRANASLGITETEVLRRLNRRIGRQTRRESSYDALIRGLLDEGKLSRASRKVEFPPDRYPWAEEQTGRWVDWVKGSGIDVVGDVDDLLMPEPPERWVDPDLVSRKALTRSALDALAAMTEAAAGRPDPGRELSARVRAKAERLRVR